MARELLHHLSSRGGKAHLADIAEPGPSCSTASCAEAVRVSLRLEEWLLENLSTMQQVATQVRGCRRFGQMCHVCLRKMILPRTISLRFSCASWMRSRMRRCWCPGSSSAPRPDPPGRRGNTGWSRFQKKQRIHLLQLQKHQAIRSKIQLFMKTFF